MGIPLRVLLSFLVSWQVWASDQPSISNELKEISHALKNFPVERESILRLHALSARTPKRARTAIVTGDLLADAERVLTRYAAAIRAPFITLSTTQANSAAEFISSLASIAMNYPNAVIFVPDIFEIKWQSQLEILNFVERSPLLQHKVPISEGSEETRTIVFPTSGITVVVGLPDMDANKYIETKVGLSRRGIGFRTSDAPEIGSDDIQTALRRILTKSGMPATILLDRFDLIIPMPLRSPAELKARLTELGVTLAPENLPGAHTTDRDLGRLADSIHCDLALAGNLL